MRRFLKWASAVLGVLIAAVVVLVLVWDWNWFRGYINEAGTSASGREFAIDGDIDVDLAWKPLIRLHKVRLSNAEWAEPENMVEIDLVQFRIDLGELLIGRIVLPELLLRAPRVELAKDENGEGNWRISRASSGGAAVEATVPEDRTEFPIIGVLQIDEGVVRYAAPADRIDLEAKISTAVGEGGKRESITLEGQGSFAEKPFSLRAIAGSLLSLRDADEPYPAAVEIKIGDTRLEAEGTADDPIQMQGLAFRLLVEGKDMEEIFPIFGIPLPETPPYRLTGNLRQNGEEWRFEEFDGKMGNSDLSGELAYLTGTERPTVKAVLSSDRLAFEDLGGLVGLTPGTGKQAEQERAKEEQQRGGRVLPDTSIDLTKLRAADMDVKFVGKQVVYPDLPIRSLDAHFLLENGRLRIEPLKMGVAGGTVAGEATVDGREDVPSVQANLSLSKLDLTEFIDNPQVAQVTDGEFGGHIDLRGSGRSVAQILGSSDGRAAISMSGGRLSHLIVELAGIDVAESLAFLFGDDEAVRVRCIVGDFDIRQGVMQSRALVIDTTDTNIGGQGTVNLGNESLDLRFLAEPKDPSPLSGRTPITIGGTMANPEIGVDPSGIAARGAAAVALGALLTPLAAIIPFIELGVGEDSDCNGLIWQASGRG